MAIPSLSLSLSLSLSVFRLFRWYILTQADFWMERRRLRNGNIEAGHKDIKFFLSFFSEPNK